MKKNGLSCLACLRRCLAPICVLLLLVAPVMAQQHRAVRLGHPNTRFAPPLTRPEQLRELFRNPRLQPDVRSILLQAGWSGDPADLIRASATAVITEMRLPRGSRLPFMSSRENGRPVALMDVLWDGDGPIEAYAFDFVSKGRRVRCITPKPCSNFYVVDLGPLPPAVGLVQHLPPTADTCSRFESTILVTNSGWTKLTAVRLVCELPEGWSVPGASGLPLAWDLGTLNPGEFRSVRYGAQANRAGRYPVIAKVLSQEGTQAQASADMVIRSPALTVDCEAPAQLYLERTGDLRIRIANQGEAEEPRAILLLSLPETAQVTSIPPEGVAGPGQIKWELGALGPGETREIALRFASPQAGRLAFETALVGACGTPVGARCETSVLGIPAILLEVVDVQDPIELTNQVVYEIRVTNQGTITDTNLRLACELEEAQVFQSATGPTPVEVDGLRLRFAPLPELGAKEVAVWRVFCTARTAGDVRFRVQLTSDHATRPVEETEATRQY